MLGRGSLDSTLDYDVKSVGMIGKMNSIIEKPNIPQNVESY